VDDNWIVAEYYRSLAMDLFSDQMSVWVSNVRPWFGANVGLRMMCWNCQFGARSYDSGFMCMYYARKLSTMESCVNWKFDSRAWI
jgi:hypothetical protein